MIKRNILDCMTLVGGTPSRYEGEKTYVSTGAVDCDHVDYAQAERVTYDNRPSRANLSVAEGDILFAKMCGTKKTLRIDRPLSEHLYSTGFCAVRANESIMNAALLYHLLASDQFLTQKDQNSSGATQKAITNAGLRKIVIQVPDLSEQRKLAANLDRIEQLMAKRREQLVSFDQLVKSRFIELFGDPVSNSPKWDTGRLGDYMTTLTDFSANGSYALLDSQVVMYDEPHYAIMVRTTDLETGDFKNGVKYIDQKAYELLGKSKLFGGEMIMNKIGSAGKIYLMPHIETPASLGRNAFMFRFDQRVNIVFLYALLTSEYGTAEIQQHVRGAVTKTITKESTRSIRIIVPPIELQEQFAAFVEQTDKSKLAVQKSLEELEILKKSLMQQYFG